MCAISTRRGSTDAGTRACRSASVSTTIGNEPSTTSNSCSNVNFQLEASLTLCPSEIRAVLVGVERETSPLRSIRATCPLSSTQNRCSDFGHQWWRSLALNLSLGILQITTPILLGNSPPSNGRNTFLGGGPWRMLASRSCSGFSAIHVQGCGGVSGERLAFPMRCLTSTLSGRRCWQLGCQERSDCNRDDSAFGPP